MSRWTQALESSLGRSSKGVFEVESGRRIAYPELLAASRRAAARLERLKSPFVSVVLPNSIEYLRTYLACLWAGRIFNPIPYFVGLGELRKILGYVKPGLLVTDRADIRGAFGAACDIAAPAETTDSPAPAAGRSCAESDIACLYYSSGTTSSPKGVLYSHGNVFSLISSINRGFGFTRATRQLALLPFGHTASINYNILPALLAGSPLYVSKGFEHLRANFFAILAEHRINYTEIVPSILLMLVNLKHKTEGLDLSALEFIGCGSSTLPLDSQKRFMELYGVKVGNLYGLSETGPSHIDDPRLPGWKPGSIGRPLDVNACKASSDGELLLKGENVFPGYHENEKLYAETVQDGWFHTGDLGHEKDGVFYFSDRKKDLIIKSGINIVPAEIEEVIYQSGLVLECAVVAKPDKVHGETVAAAVVAKDGVDAGTLEKRLRDYCKEHLSSYKTPSHIRIVEKIPKTHSGKLLRKKVREEFAQ